MELNAIRRGLFVTVVAPGDFGKSRPALVVRSDLFSALPTVAVLLLTSDLRDDADQVRIEVSPTAENGLRQPSQIAIDKIVALRPEKLGAVIGKADDALLVRVNRALAVYLGIA